MNKSKIQTPAILLDLNILEKNLKTHHQMASANSKYIWPMIKTHKSTEIARMQLDYGATGFLCGTLDECEAIYETFVCNDKRNISIMYAYPVASQPNIARVVKLAKKCNFYLRLDGYEQAALLNKAGEDAGVCINYTVIINSGLNRLGVLPCTELKNLVNKISHFKHLKLCGISTHPGHAYSEIDIAGIKKVAQQESGIMQTAAQTLHSMKITPQLITTGSTPTYPYVVNDLLIGIFHPGNYVFMDNMQVALECVTEAECALTVLVTVISNPREGEYIIDAGTKCLSLDKGAHGTGKITGHGRVKNYEDTIDIVSLSEEVGKIIVDKKHRNSVKVGDKLEIIPNHACATANNTSCFIGIRKGVVDKVISVDMRGNSTAK